MNLPPGKKNLVIAGASSRSAAQRAAIAGFDLLAFDQFSDRDLRAIAQVNPLDSLFDLGEVFWQPWADAPLLLCGGMENRLDAIDYLIGRGLVCGLSTAALTELRNIDAWSKWSKAAGFGWPETTILPASPSLAMTHDARGSELWLIKSRNGAGGLGVRAWKGEPLEPFQYLQRQIEGEVLGVTFISQSDKSYVVGCTQSWPVDSFWGPLPFIYRGSVGPVRLESGEWIRLMDFASRIHKTTGIKGLWQADFIRNRDGWWLLEINPRWSSSMELLEIAYDMSLVEQHVWAVLSVLATGGASNGRDRHSSRCLDEGDFVIGKVVRYASEDLSPTPTMLERWWEHRWDGASTSLWQGNRLADIPCDIAPIPIGYPICTEYAMGKSVVEVQHRLQESVMAEAF